MTIEWEDASTATYTAEKTTINGHVVLQVAYDELHEEILAGLPEEDA